MQGRGWRGKSEQGRAAPVAKVELGPSLPRTHCLTVHSVLPRCSRRRLEEGLHVSRAAQWGEDAFRKELEPGGQWGTAPSPAELLARQSAPCKVPPGLDGTRVVGAPERSWAFLLYLRRRHTWHGDSLPSVTTPCCKSCPPPPTHTQHSN